MSSRFTWTILCVAGCLMAATCSLGIDINDLPWEVRNAISPVHIDWSGAQAVSEMVSVSVDKAVPQPVQGIRNVADLQPSNPQVLPTGAKAVTVGMGAGTGYGRVVLAQDQWGRPVAVTTTATGATVGRVLSVSEAHALGIGAADPLRSVALGPTGWRTVSPLGQPTGGATVGGLPTVGEVAGLGIDLYGGPGRVALVRDEAGRVVALGPALTGRPLAGLTGIGDMDTLTLGSGTVPSGVTLVRDRWGRPIALGSSVTGRPVEGILGIGGAHVLSLGGVPRYADGVTLAPDAGGVPATVQQPSPVKDMKGLDPRVMAMGGKCADTIQQENMSIEEFVAWTHEERLTKEDIVAAMQYSGIDWPELDPESMPLAAALLDRIGDDLEGLEEIPMMGRLLLATYLGKLGREDDVRKVYAAITDEELLAQRRRDLHCVSSHLMDDAPFVALDILKRYAEVLSERRLLCTEFRITCRTIGDKAIVEKELIPFAQRALESMPPTAYWGSALRALIWGYQYLGDDDSAVREGLEWLQKVEDLGLNTDSNEGLYTKIMLAQSCAKTGRSGEAAVMLRTVVSAASADSWLAKTAQAQLIELARIHADIGEVALLPPRFERIFPDRLALSVRLGEQVPRSITVSGNPTLKVTKVDCALPFIQAVVRKTTMTDGGSTHLIQLSIKPSGKSREQRGGLFVQTNDAEKTTVEVPIAIEVLSPIIAQPDSFFFGFVKPGEIETATVTLASTLPFAITDTKVQNLDLLSVEGAKQEDNSYVLKATVHGSNPPGIVEGNIYLSTNLTTQPTMTIRYYGHIGVRR